MRNNDTSTYIYKLKRYKNKIVKYFFFKLKSVCQCFKRIKIETVKNTTQYMKIKNYFSKNKFRIKINFEKYKNKVNRRASSKKCNK